MVDQPVAGLDTSQLEALRQLNFRLLTQVNDLKMQVESYEQEVSYYKQTIEKLRGSYQEAAIAFFRKETIELECQLQASEARNLILDEQLQLQASNEAKAKAQARLKRNAHHQLEASTMTESTSCKNASMNTHYTTSWWAWADAVDIEYFQAERDRTDHL